MPEACGTTLYPSRIANSPIQLWHDATGITRTILIHKCHVKSHGLALAAEVCPVLVAALCSCLTQSVVIMTDS